MYRFLSLSTVSIIQGVSAAIVLVAVAWTPPSHGFMLIVPVFATSRPAMVATRSGALISGAGRLPGSWVIFGDRSLILRAALTDGSIILASKAEGCGGGDTPS